MRRREPPSSPRRRAPRFFDRLVDQLLRGAALLAQRVGLAVAALLRPRQPELADGQIVLQERAALLHEPRQVIGMLVRGDDDVEVRAGGGDQVVHAPARAGPGRSVWRLCTPQSISTYLVVALPAGSASRKQSPSPWRYIRTMSSFGFGTSSCAAAGGAAAGLAFVAFFGRSRSLRRFCSSLMSVGPRVFARSLCARANGSCFRSCAAHRPPSGRSARSPRPLLRELIAQERHVPRLAPLARGCSCRPNR